MEKTYPIEFPYVNGRQQNISEGWKFRFKVRGYKHITRYDNGEKKNWEPTMVTYGVSPYGRKEQNHPNRDLTHYYGRLKR